MRNIRGFKRVILVSLTFMMMFLMSVSAGAAFEATREGVNYPTHLNVGEPFSISGVVRANANIARATVTIYDAAGTTCLQRYSVTPNTKVFNIAEADSGILFNTLKTGEYYYRVSIFNSANVKYAVVNRKFTVGNVTVKPTLTKKGITVPVTLTAGKEFAMKGSITANFKFKTAVFTIYNSAGTKCLQRYTANVNGTSYDVKKADPYLHFEKLAPGSYYYRICVYNQANQKIRVTNTKFKVVAGSSIKISNPIPAANVSIKQGTVYAIGGTITSAKKLSKVTGKIINSNGTVVYSKTVKPNAKKFVLKNSLIDSALYFEKLPAGKYTVNIVAQDSAGATVTVINKVVTVKSVTPVTPPQSDLIQILYEIPDKDVTIKEGSSFGLGGIIAAKNKMNRISVVLKNASGKIVSQKSINPSAKVYILDNSILDAAIEFELLPAGSYQLTISATDVLGNGTELMKHLVVVK